MNTSTAHHINAKRVLLCGLKAGVVIFLAAAVIHGVVLDRTWHEVLQEFRQPDPPRTAGGFLAFLGISVLKGIAAVWLYAAIRPRFGPGVGTAALAGAVAGVIGAVLPWLSWAPMGLFPVRLWAIAGLGEGLAAVPACALGCWLYAEKVAETGPEEP